MTDEQIYGGSDVGSLKIEGVLKTALEIQLGHFCGFVVWLGYLVGYQYFPNHKRVTECTRVGLTERRCDTRGVASKVHNTKLQNRVPCNDWLFWMVGLS